jgi:hypothetical protein
MAPEIRSHFVGADSTRSRYRSKHRRENFQIPEKLQMRRFFLLENRLIRNPALQKDYVAFMQDYLEAGHMSLAPPAMGTTARSYYIPHHCVQKPDSATSKLRVVFDASAKCANGQSLNGTLHTRPKLLQHIVRVLLNFRLHRVVFTADVRQMYRQISIAPDDLGNSNASFGDRLLTMR